MAPSLHLKMCAGCTAQYAVEGDVGDEQGGSTWYGPCCRARPPFFPLPPSDPRRLGPWSHLFTRRKDSGHGGLLVRFAHSYIGEPLARWLHDLYAVMWEATWGNNMASLEWLIIVGGIAWLKRDHLGTVLAAWWAKHHGPHAIAQYKQALDEHGDSTQ
jgi:hypothetical protein